MQEWPKTQQLPRIALVRPATCCVKNTSEMSVFSKEYTFPTLLLFFFASVPVLAFNCLYCCGQALNEVELKSWRWNACSRIQMTQRTSCSVFFFFWICCGIYDGFISADQIPGLQQGWGIHSVWSDMLAGTHNQDIAVLHFGRYLGYALSVRYCWDWP
jgi:hypothetical protein